MNEVSIYVHIPFCESKCYYCDFNSGKYSAQIQEKYFDALKNEIIQNKIKNKIKSIYFGGGTPSVVDEQKIIEILNLIKNNFDVKNDAEISIECNPNSLNQNKLLAFKNAGFNRLSLGVQTTNKKSLKIIGRIQEKNKSKNYKNIIKNNLKYSKKIGFNISADLMLGLPKNNIFNLFFDVFLLNKYCKHISVYMLTLYRGTKLYEKYSDKSLEKRTIKQYKFVCNLLKLLKFEQYEISNFAKNKNFSKHNLNYWDSGEYLGFGLSAHSHLGDYRYSNTQNIDKYFSNFHNKKFEEGVKSYIEIIEQNKQLKNNVEHLSAQEKAEEFLMLSLRQAKGLNLTQFKNEFFDLLKLKVSEVEELKKLKLIKIKDDILLLTKKGILFENFVELKLC